MAASDEQSDTRQGLRRTSLLYHGLLACVILVGALIFSHGRDCGPSQLGRGQWLGGRWVTDGCVMHSFQMSEVPQCFAKRPHIVFVGEKRLWKHYITLLRALGVTAKSNEFQYKHPGTDIVLEYVHQQYLDNTTPIIYKQLSEGLTDSALLLVHQPQQLALENVLVKDKCKGVDNIINAQQWLLKAALAVPTITTPPLQLLLSPQPLEYMPHYLPEEIANKMTQCLSSFRQRYARLGNSSSLISFVRSPLSHPPSYIWTQPPLVNDELNVILNSFCNTPDNATCCVEQDFSTGYSTVTSALLIAILAVYAGVSLIFASGATFALTPHLEAASCNLDKFFAIFNSLGALSGSLLYLLMAESLDYFAHVARVPSLLFFFLFLIAVAMAAPLFQAQSVGVAVASGSASEFFGLEHVREMRGLAVLFFIAISYAAIDKYTSFYLLRELMVSVIVFLGGYTSFQSLWTCEEQAWRRVVKVLVELNFLSLCVWLALGRLGGGAYLPALLSTLLLFTLAFMAVPPSLSPTKQQQDSQSTSLLNLAIKTAVVFILLALIPSPDIILSFNLPTTFTDFYQHFYVHRFAGLSGVALGGVVCVLQASSALLHHEHTFRRTGTACSAVALLVYLLFIFLCEDGAKCLPSHAYLSSMAIVAYVFLRTCSPSLLGNHSHLLAWAGQSTLWLFIAYHHILAGRDGRSHLSLFPGMPFLNSLASLVVFFFVARIVRLGVTVLRKYAALGSTLRAESAPVSFTV